jgi:Flp pilus assembly protein TadD
LILCHDRQFAKAIQLAEIVVNDDGSNAAAHVILGVALAGMGQNDQALSEMQKALALNPRLSEAHYNLARLLIKKEPKNKATKATAGKYYLNALKFGAAPDPDLAKLLQK